MLERLTWAAFRFVLACAVGTLAVTAQPAQNRISGKELRARRAGPQVPVRPESVRIVRQPEDQFVSVGQSATFTVQPEGKASEFSYQWVFNGRPVAGATNATLVISWVGMSDVGRYSCFVHRYLGAGFDLPPIHGQTGGVSLMAYTTTNNMILVSTPPVPGSGNGGDCPANYIGYTTFPGSWAAIPGYPSGSARHLESNLTDVKAWSSTIRACGHGGRVNIGGSQYVQGRRYQFTVFFPSNSFNAVPTANQTLLLEGFR
jgi:hypothetical protein